MSMSRRGQGISINMVVIAAIALLVLVIGTILVAKTGRNVNENAGAQSCSALGGVCKAGCDYSPTGEPLETNEGRRNCQQGQVCCVYNFNK